MSKKICLIVTSLGKGGAERSSAILSKLLFDLGYDVSVVTTKNVLDYNYSGKLFNLELELNGKSNGYIKFKVLKKYFKHNKFDYLIDNRTRSRFLKELILYRYVFRVVSIISVVRSFNLRNYLPRSKFLAKFLYGDIYKVIAVSERIKEEIESVYNLKNVERIYNCFDIREIKDKSEGEESFPGKFILFFGRIEERVKNLTLLINGYKESMLAQSNIKLLILGGGPDLSEIRNMVNELGLSQDVIFVPFKANPFPFVRSALFTILTSRYEGFPRSIIESLICETPVISVDCDSGPREIIINKQNGLLIDNYSVEALAKAMNLFIEDKELYTYCKNNTFDSVSHLEIDKISLEWKKIIDGGI